MTKEIPERGKVLTSRTLDLLIEALMREGVINTTKLKSAEDASQKEKEPLSRALIKLGFVTSEQIAKLIGEQVHIPHVNIKNYIIDRRVLDIIPEKVARRYNIIPLFKIENVLTVAMADPQNIISIDEISAVAKFKVEPVIASEESIQEAIDQWYGIGDSRKNLIEELIKDFVETSKREEDEENEEKQLTRGLNEVRIKKEADEVPVIKIVNSYIIQAILEGASDIHMEPKRDHMAVRFRIDGFLHLRHEIPNKLAAPITARLKILAGLDISKRRIPQDGRVSIIIRDKKIDLRTSVFPSMHGENVVLRILDRTAGPPPLSELGFSEHDLNTFKTNIRATKGIILASGPTGSGKTTTIYSAINTLNTKDKNIMTIEDPIEYEIEGIVQSQINLKAGVTFANSLRSILRQDPDIIYVGEIRDQETAEIAVRSALTGHLVVSTIHTNNAVGVTTRLIDIGVEPDLIASVLNCSFAQRLVRKNCPRCIKEYIPDDKLLKRMGLSLEIRYQKGTGCDFCNGTGYRGRIGIFEILVVNKDISRLIAKKAFETEIIRVAREQGMKPLLEDGLLKVTKGITSLEEVARVTLESE